MSHTNRNAPYGWLPGKEDYNSPVGCPSTRVVEEPYIDTVCEMKFPDNLEDPAQQFASAIQRYVDMAEQKLEHA